MKNLDGSAQGSGTTSTGGSAWPTGAPEKFAFGANLVVSAGNFLFLVMVARTVSPSLFGAFAALSALVLLYEVPASTVQTTVTRAMAPGARAREAPYPPSTSVQAGPLLADSLVGGLVISLALLLAAPLIVALLRLPGPTSAILLAVGVLPVAVALVPKATLVASGRLGMLGTALAAGTVTKLVVGIALVHGGAGLDGALASVVAGELVAAAVTLAAVRRDLEGRQREAVPNRDTGRPTTVPPRESAHACVAPVSLAAESLRWREAAPTALSFTGYWLLAGADLAVARHWLSPASSGLFAAAATTAQLAMFAPATFAAVSIPRFAAALQRPSLARRRLLFAMTVTVAAGAALSVFTALGGRPLELAMFDSSYRGAGSITTLLMLSAGMFGLATIVVTSQLARGVRLSPLLPWLGVAVLLAIAWAWHSQTQAIAWASLSANAAVCLALALTAAHRESPEMAEPARRLDEAAADLELTVVVPYYNPGPALRRNVERLLEALAATGSAFEVVAVSDGSTDGSHRCIEDIADPHLRRVVLAANRGKGAALGAGLVLGRGRYLGFIDADGDLDPSLLASFVEIARNQTPDVVLGSKRHPLSTVNYPLIRRLYSRGYQLLIRAFFHLNLRDTQTGIKLFRREVLAAALPRMVEKRFAWDLELFVVARRLGFERFVEVPVVVKHQLRSTVSFRSVRHTFVDTLGIYYRLRLLHWYDEEHRNLLEPGGQSPAPLIFRPGLGPSALSWVMAPLQGHSA